MQKLNHKVSHADVATALSGIGVFLLPFDGSLLELPVPPAEGALLLRLALQPPACAAPGSSARGTPGPTLAHRHPPTPTHPPTHPYTHIHTPVDALQVEGVGADAPDDGRVVAGVLAVRGTAVKGHAADATYVIACASGRTGDRGRKVQGFRGDRNAS